MSGTYVWLASYNDGNMGLSWDESVRVGVCGHVWCGVAFQRAFKHAFSDGVTIADRCRMAVHYSPVWCYLNSMSTVCGSRLWGLAPRAHTPGYPLVGLDP